MILIIDNYDSFVYNLFQRVAPLTDKEVRVLRNDAITVDDIAKLNPTHIILSPGPGRPEDAGICVETIRQLSGKIPLLGVCLGHQAMGIAFGGSVISAGEIVHGKPEEIFHYQKALYREMPLPFMAARYHSLMVARENLPDVFLIEAENKNSMIMGMRHKTHPTFGVQFHPESILTPEGDRLLQAFVEGHYA